jgi:hypothetical protein
MNVNYALMLMSVAFPKQVSTVLNCVKKSLLSATHVGINQNDLLSIAKDGLQVPPELVFGFGEANGFRAVLPRCAHSKINDRPFFASRPC